MPAAPLTVTQEKIDVIKQAGDVLFNGVQGDKWDALVADTQNLVFYMGRTLKQNKPVTSEQQKAFAHRDDIVFTVLCALSRCEGGEDIRNALGKQFPAAYAKAENLRRTSTSETNEILPQRLEFYLKEAAAADALAEYIKTTIASGKTPQGESQNGDRWTKDGYTGRDHSVSIPMVYDPDASSAASTLDKLLYQPLSEYLDALKKIQPHFKALNIVFSLNPLLYEKLGWKDESLFPGGSTQIKIKEKGVFALMDEADNDALNQETYRPTLEVKMMISGDVIDLVRAQLKQNR